MNLGEGKYVDVKDTPTAYSWDPLWVKIMSAKIFSLGEHLAGN